MKTIVTLLCSFLSLSLLAQEVTLSFAGANKTRNFQVVIDGASYYSANAQTTNGRNVVTISNLNVGSHSIAVYNMGNNSTANVNGSTNRPVEGEEIYSKTFQLRQGFDMNISIRPNGLVSFTEKKAVVAAAVPSTSGVNGTPMSTVTFNKLLQTVKAKRYQSEKISLITTAFRTNANYFTTGQAKQLITLVTAESRRIELAKLSYKKITDPGNFTSLYDVIKSEAGRDLLDDYVVEQGGIVSAIETNTAYAPGTAMTTTVFNQLIQAVQNKYYQDEKITEVRNALNKSNNYFTTAQLKQLIGLVSSENDRLPLVKMGYTHTVDVANFNQLTELFTVQYNRDELNNFIVSNGGAANTTAVKPAMTATAFAQIYNQARSHFFTKNTVNEVRVAFNTASNLFSTDQVRQLLMLVPTEVDRLALAKLAYARVVDTNNFINLVDLFPTQSNKTDLETFVRSQK